MSEQQPKSREEILAAIKAKADAIRAQRTAAGPPSPEAAPAAGAPAVSLETFVSSLNAAGRPAAAPQNKQLRAFGSVNFAVELLCEPTEEENLRKLLGGVGAYQNPLRAGAFQIDYRYYAEAKRRLAAAGYQIEEDQFARLAPAAWSPTRGGWTRVEE